MAGRCQTVHIITKTSKTRPQLQVWYSKQLTWASTSRQVFRNSKNSKVTWTLKSLKYGTPSSMCYTLPTFGKVMSHNFKIRWFMTPFTVHFKFCPWPIFTKPYISKVSFENFSWQTQFIRQRSYYSTFSATTKGLRPSLLFR